VRGERKGGEGEERNGRFRDPSPLNKDFIHWFEAV